MRRYQGFMVDSARWQRFEFRPDDIVISTPSKCGTTWLQNIVGMLVLGRADLGEPLSVISPWLDMLAHTDEHVFELLAAQRHRRFIKTHTPLDGVPMVPGVTYLTIVRHPLDVALSDRDHAANVIAEEAIAARIAASGPPPPSTRSQPPDDPAEFLRWWIDNDDPPRGSGPDGLADLANQVNAAWAVRDLDEVVLLHYDDLWHDLDGEMRRLAGVLGVEIDDELWPALVDAATIDSMRARADDTAPEAHRPWWHDNQRFFAVGGRRDWAALLTDDDLAHFHQRLVELTGDAADWVLRGRVALATSLTTGVDDQPMR